MGPLSRALNYNRIAPPRDRARKGANRFSPKANTPKKSPCCARCKPVAALRRCAMRHVMLRDERLLFSLGSRSVSTSSGARLYALLNLLEDNEVDCRLVARARKTPKSTVPQP